MNSNQIKLNQNEIEAYTRDREREKQNRNWIQHSMKMAYMYVYIRDICGHIFHGILFNIDKVKFMHSLRAFNKTDS